MTVDTYGERERIFLGYHCAPLREAARVMIDRVRSGTDADLSGWIVVLPGKRAGRKFLESLLAVASTENLRLIPPSKIITPGAIPELFYAPRFAVATAVEKKLAWCRALDLVPEDLRAPLIPIGKRGSEKREGPATESAPPSVVEWLPVAQQLSDLVREVSTAELSVEELAQRIEALGDFSDAERWQSLIALYEAYRETLADLSLCDLDIERREALQERLTPPRAAIALVGVVDLSPLNARFLRHATQVTSLIIGDDADEAGFDLLGSAIPSYWRDRPIPLPSASIEFCKNPEGEAYAARDYIAEISSRRTVDDVTVCACDESVIPYLAGICAEEGVPLRDLRGASMRRSLPFLFLQGVADLLWSGEFLDAGTLLRHPDITRFLMNKGIGTTYLTAFDTYQGAHLQLSARSPLPGESNDRAIADQVLGEILRLLSPLRGSPRILAHWGDRILGLLKEIYLDSPPDPIDCAALDLVRGELEQWLLIPEGLQPTVDAGVALALLLSGVADHAIEPRTDREAIEILGWLELALDDRPVLVIAGANEGLLPESLNGHFFLPNKTRSIIGILDNDRRYARDAAILVYLTNAKEDLRLLAARHSMATDPLSLSRLLLADPDHLIERTEQFFTESSSRILERRAQREEWEQEKKFSLPYPAKESGARISEVSVSGINDYLRSPYLFYLRHVAKVRECNDTALEMNERIFGQLVHRVLDAFGQGTVSRATDEKVIAEFLLSQFEHHVVAHFGRSPLPAVVVQCEQVRRRLQQFARWQAQWRREGWEIRYVEHQIRAGEVIIETKRGPISITGRIDRIDLHPATKEWAVIDYKTGSTVKEVSKLFQKRKGLWCDLQLPLYRRLLRSLIKDDTVQLGYLALDGGASGVSPNLTRWSEEEYAHADRQTDEILNGIAEGRFDLESMDGSPAEIFRRGRLAWLIGGDDDEDTSDGEGAYE